jgi:uncharacterized protein GlcG (DUF336 family)
MEEHMSTNQFSSAAFAIGAGLAISTVATSARADALSCPVSYQQLKSALVTSDSADTTGFNNHFWGVVVNRGGVICAVAYSGSNTGAQWLGSRQIAAAKAFTANAFSLPLNGGTGTTALSTAQLYQFVQPSNANVANPLYGLDSGNVLDSTVVYRGEYAWFGTPQDPMIGSRAGGTITFGGGLALYSGTSIVGGIGLSGDTACADHSTAWRTRIALKLQQANPTDQLPFATNPSMRNGHPHCPNDSGTQGATGGNAPS